MEVNLFVRGGRMERSWGGMRDWERRVRRRRRMSIGGMEDALWGHLSRFGFKVVGGKEGRKGEMGGGRKMKLGVEEATLFMFDVVGSAAF